MTKLDDYYLDITAVYKLDSTTYISAIMELYRDLISYSNIGGTGFNTVFNTLLKSGFLKNKTTEEREEKIEGIVNE